MVDLETPDGSVNIRVSADPRDYQQARVYEENVLLESLLVREGTVVYVDEAAQTTAKAIPPR
jgi:hypothetical protein